MKRFEQFLVKIGIEPKDMSVYRRALTHLSAADNFGESYERLEFLGDSVIGMIISDFLIREYPEKGEGELTRIKATVVSREVLGEKARSMGVDRHLRVDTARVRNGGDAEFSILSDCFEALTGALLLDRGYMACKKFVLMHLKDDCIAMKDIEGPTDFKSKLQEIWQQEYKEPPEYHVVRESGPDHSKTFSIEVRYNGKKLGIGSGKSKKKAEQSAAENALKKLNKKITRKERKRD
ncbi:MAG TPA: ribonuclease III [bacterium]|jgi:ribonuclease-3